MEHGQNINLNMISLDHSINAVIPEISYLIYSNVSLLFWNSQQKNSKCEKEEIKHLWAGVSKCHE